VLSLTICERIFHAGREPLMRIGWFRVTIRFVVGLRDAVFGWVKSTAIWRAAAGLARSVREWVVGLFRGAKQQESKRPAGEGGPSQSRSQDP
jgi:hypothetical protein